MKKQEERNRDWASAVGQGTTRPPGWGVIHARAHASYVYHETETRLVVHAHVTLPRLRPEFDSPYVYHETETRLVVIHKIEYHAESDTIRLTWADTVNLDYVC